MDVISLVLIFTLLLFIVVAANLAERERRRGVTSLPLMALAYGSTALLFLLLFFIGIGVQGLGVLVSEPGAISGATLPFEQLGVDPAQGQAFLTRLPIIGFGLWMPALIALVLLLPPARRLSMRFTRLDPANHVHAIALALTMLTLINLLVTLGVGLDTLAAGLADSAQAGQTVNLLPSLWAQQLLTALLAFVGVGWLTRRSWSETLDRLKLLRPTRRQVALGLAVALILVPAVAGLEWLGGRLGWMNSDVENLTEQLIGPLLTSASGILTVGLAAALGEETLFRGALQPRFGRIPTSLLFALLHSTYGLSLATVAVFILGYILGWVRDRYGTGTSMVVHAAYNLTLGVISLVAGGASV